MKPGRKILKSDDCRAPPGRRYWLGLQMTTRQLCESQRGKCPRMLSGVPQAEPALLQKSCALRRAGILQIYGDLELKEKVSAPLTTSVFSTLIASAGGVSTSSSHRRAPWFLQECPQQARACREDPLQHHQPLNAVSTSSCPLKLHLHTVSTLGGGSRVSVSVGSRGSRNSSRLTHQLLINKVLWEI